MADSSSIEKGAVTDLSAGYGRVGQNVQQDEHAPKRLDALSQRVKAAADPKVLQWTRVCDLHVTCDIDV